MRKYIDTILNKINEYKQSKKLISHNKNFFKKKENLVNGKILVEFNAFHDHHITYSLFTNYLSQKYNCKIEAFFNYSLLSAPLNFNCINSAKWFIGNLLGLKNFGIYKSFNVDKIFRPIISKNLKQKSDVLSNKISKNIKNKEDVLNISINNVLIGDLIYDTFLKSKVLPTINIKSEEFSIFLFNFICLFLFWQDYFKKYKVKFLITSHEVYSYGLPLRIATQLNIKSFIINVKYLRKLKKDNIYGEFSKYKNFFSKINKSKRNSGLKLAKTQLEKRFSGNILVNDLDYTDKSSFKKIRTSNKFFLKKNDKIKILICTHDFFDAVHVHGKNIFPDFYEWLNFLIKIKKNTNYDWYIKNHPKYSGRYKIYQPYTDKIIEKFASENKIKILPNNLSHLKIIKEGINLVLTVYGTVGMEYPYFGIPVINACRKNPHSAFNFSENPKTKDEYESLIKNCKKIKVNKFAKKEIIQYYFMNNIIIDNQWLFDDYNKVLKKIGGYHNLQSIKFYEYWLDYSKNINLKKIHLKFDKFLTSKHSYLLKKKYL